MRESRNIVLVSRKSGLPDDEMDLSRLTFVGDIWKKAKTMNGTET